MTPAKRLILMGRLYRNMLVNGHFTNGLTGWASSTGSTVVDGIYKIIPVAQYRGVYQEFYRIANHVFYMAAKCKVSSLNVNLVLFDSILATHPGDGNYHVLSGTKSFATDLENSDCGIKDYKTSDFTEINVDWVLLIDLTAEFGAGNEPTLEWCDANIPQNIIW